MNELHLPKALLPLEVTGSPDLTSTVRYLAALKNIPLTPDQSAALARTTRESFATWHEHLADGDTRRLSVLTNQAVDRTLDIVAAVRVMRLVAHMVDGNLEPDHTELTRRATAMVDQFIGETNNSDMHRWPDPYETFRAHYGSVPWGPIHHTLPDGTVTITYLLNAVMHRDPKEGPAFECGKDDWRYVKYCVHGQIHRDHRDGPAIIQQSGSELARCEEYYDRGVLHRPTADGPAVIWTDRAGHRTHEAWYEHGALHRDPKHGPARYCKDHEGEEWEYAVNGKRHRDPADGPAFIFTVADGKPVRGEEYFFEGRWHRPSEEGPAILQTDASGKRLFEIYVEHGEPHRDPAIGPAWYSVEIGIEDIRYQVRGTYHRDEREGPARIHTDEATGIILLEEYLRDGQSHRTDGPAHVTRDANGIVTSECWFQNGQFHRDPGDGPAYMCRDDEGLVTREYWVDGRQVELRHAPHDIGAATHA